MWLPRVRGNGGVKGVSMVVDYIRREHRKGLEESKLCEVL